MAIFISPVIYLNTAKKAIDKKLLKEFLELASQHRLNITEVDFWNDRFGIGLDSAAKKLFYMRKEKDTATVKVIELMKVKNCRANRVNRSVAVNRSTREIVDRLELVFMPIDLKDSDLSSNLIFYQGDESLGLKNELPLLNKWEQRIQGLLG